MAVNRMFRTCPSSGLVFHEPAEKLMRWNAVAAAVSLLVGGVLAIGVVLTRWQAVHLLPADRFYQVLTAHGLNMLVFWIIFFEIAAVDRACAYVEAGADMIFAEALQTLDDYRAFTRAVGVPVLANLTEFGMTPLFTVRELAGAGVQLVLYPLSAFRAMSRAAEAVYAALRKHGTQASMLDAMQTRNELYDVLDYYAYERKLDELFANAPRRESPRSRRAPRATKKKRPRKAPR